MAKNRLHDEAVLVIGLGRFGGAAALELQRLGHPVVAVEKDALSAESFSRKLARVLHADAASPDGAESGRAPPPPTSWRPSAPRATGWPSSASGRRWRPRC